MGGRRAVVIGAGPVAVRKAQLDYGTLNLIEGKDPDDPESYIPGGYSGSGDMLRVPVGNATTASHRGINVYTYRLAHDGLWHVLTKCAEVVVIMLASHVAPCRGFDVGKPGHCRGDGLEVFHLGFDQEADTFRAEVHSPCAITYLLKAYTFT
ncbi:MAG: hypothetical protein ACYTBJ_22555 [Planctomycetota bacterium]